MDLSLLPPLTAFTAVAFAVGACYLLLMWLVNTIVSALWRFRRSRPVSCRPGEVVHQALKITGRRSDQYRTAALLFGVSFGLLFSFGRYGWWPDWSNRVYGAIAVAFLFALNLAAIRIWRLMRYRIRLSRLLDAYIEVAQRLTEAQLRGNRVYHAVPIDGDIIDNVIVGSNGVYTVSLIMPPAQSCETVSFKRRRLVFEPGTVRQNISPYRQSIVALTRALSQCVGEPVVVQPVIVVPDCRVEQAPEGGPLLVSMESCSSFLGWTDQRAFLMTDDVAKINDWLSRRVLENQPRSLRQVVRCLHGQVERPIRT